MSVKAFVWRPRRSEQPLGRLAGKWRATLCVNCVTFLIRAITHGTAYASSLVGFAIRRKTGVWE